MVVLLNQVIPKVKSKAISIKEGAMPSVEKLITSTTELIRGNPLTSAAVIGVSTAGVTAGISRYVSTKTKKKTTRKKSAKTSRKKKTTKRKTKKRGRYTPHTAGKGRDRSTKRIRYTKKGQPYVITRSGKAKFIKKSSAKRSHKLKGGRY